MKNSSLGHQERKVRVVFDGFLAVFGVFGSVVSLRQGLSDKLLAFIMITSQKIDNKKAREYPGLFYKKIPVNLSPIGELFTGIGLFIYVCFSCGL